MPIDFGRMSPPRHDNRISEPISLFQSLRVSDPAINDLWLAQGDALREWDMHRTSPDVAILLNTGAGKTLVGLLVAQSLVNEARGHVLYACSSIQLVQQTAVKAHGYGINVTTYVRNQFSDDLYHQAVAPCVTTYQALFNSRSVFARQDVRAVIFDDAHTASHLLRDQFTLHVERSTHPETFSQLVQLFRPYFGRIGKELSYIESYQRQDGSTLSFVPPFAVKAELSELQRVMLEASFGDRPETLFPWEHLRNHLDVCAVFVSGTEVTFTPPVVPVLTLRYFGNSIRRVYLSATLTAQDAFLHSFGRTPDVVITPSTSAGECERMILVPALQGSRQQNDAALDAAKQIIENQKSLVIVPTKHRRQAWDSVATGYKEGVPEQVEQFKRDAAPACLTLTARYDGVDLPGDTCRMLVIDGLPTGLNPLERYQWEGLGLQKVLRSAVASRIVQSFGRISRGMSDHGVVVLTGNTLVDWVLSPKNRSLLPPFLQRQLQLGFHVTRQAETTEDLVAVAHQCLFRDAQWVSYYEQHLDDYEAIPPETDDLKQTLSIVQAEVEFGHALWSRDFASAAKALERELERTFIASRATGAWHALWLGYMYERLDDIDRAQDLYSRAHGAATNIPPSAAARMSDSFAGLSPQIGAVATLLHGGASSHLEVPKRFDVDLAALDGSGSVPQIEAALESLGQYLGLSSSRPDNDVGSGPDILWAAEGGPALSMEAKTAKGENAVYKKEDLGQLRDHRQWVRESLGEVEIFSAFVGPPVRATWDANPDPDIVVIELEVFRKLRDRLRAALNDVCTAAVPARATTTIHDLFLQRGLVWPDVYLSLPKVALRDISKID